MSIFFFFYPKPIASKRRNVKQRAISDISSAEWQEFMKNKERKEKEKLLATLKCKKEQRKTKTEKIKKK